MEICFKKYIINKQIRNKDKKTVGTCNFVLQKYEHEAIQNTT